MAEFKEAQTNSLIDARAKEHARLALAAMTESELGLERRHMLRGRDRMKHKGIRSEEIQSKQAPVRGIKRRHDEAFSDSLVVKQGT